MMHTYGLALVVSKDKATLVEHGEASARVIGIAVPLTASDSLAEIVEEGRNDNGLLREMTSRVFHHIAVHLKGMIHDPSLVAVMTVTLGVEVTV